MPRKGSDYLKGIQHGHGGFINGERIEDVRRIPRFAAVRSVPGLDELSSDAANSVVLTVPHPTNETQP